ncbi:MFS transporter [Paucibacter soli]|uniref:MFS transporter n=1 Tax=Paucibacter soli TaxID=3133433 RepID=UPI00309F849F
MLQFWGRVQACAMPVRLLMLSEMFHLLANAVGQLALSWWIAQRGGAADLSRYGALMAACSLLAMPLLSPLGDRWPKRRLIRLGKLLLLLDALALWLLACSAVYSLALLCACSLLSIVANAALLPAQASILAELVPAAELPAAIRLRRGAQALGGLLGPSLAGAALALGDMRLALGLNLAMFAIAALAGWCLAEPSHASAPAPHAAWLADLRAGLRAKWGVPLDRWWTLTGALMMVFLLPAIGMLLPLRVQALGLSALWFGACTAALSLGLLLGVAGLADLLMARLDRVRAMAAALALCGLAVAGIGLVDWAPGLLLLFAAIGLGMSVTQLVGQTHRTLAIPEAFRARMAAGQLALAQVAAALAPLLAGLLLQHWAVASVYLLLALGFGFSGLLLLLVPGLAPFLRMDHADAQGWYGRRYPEAFAPPRA